MDFHDGIALKLANVEGVQKNIGNILAYAKDGWDLAGFRKNSID